MIKGLIERLISVDQINVFADHADANRALALTEFAPDHVFPLRQVSRRLSQPKALEDIVVESAFLKMTGYLINRVGIHQRNHRSLVHVGEEGDLAARAFVDLYGASAQQHLGLQANRAQFFNRVLGRLGFDFAGSRNIGNERQVHEQRIGRAQLQLELTHRLQKRLALDVACGAAHFHHRDFCVSRALDNPAFDFIGDMRNDLHRATQVIASSLLAQHCVVYPTRREVIGAAHHGAREALVMAEIEVCLRAIIRNKHLAVLERAHRAGVDVDVGV